MENYSDTPSRTRHPVMVVVAVVVVARVDATQPGVAETAARAAGRSIAGAASLDMGSVELRFGGNVKEAGFMSKPDRESR